MSIIIINTSYHDIADRKLKASGVQNRYVVQWHSSYNLNDFYSAEDAEIPDHLLLEEWMALLTQKLCILRSAYSLKVYSPD